VATISQTEGPAAEWSEPTEQPLSRPA
jgi:hypothetical protein